MDEKPFPPKAAPSVDVPGKREKAAKTPRPRSGPAALRSRAPARLKEAAGADAKPRKTGPRSGSTRAGAQPKQTLSEDAPSAYAFEDVVSGALDGEDAEEVSAAPAPHKRVLQPDAEQPKLHKVLAQAGVGSRLEMEALILEGRISVNDQPAHVGQRVQYGDQIKLSGKPIRFRIAPPATRVLAYHKVAGEMVTRDDPKNRPTVFRRLPPLHQGKWQAVGRLDLNTEGLLLFTNSGDLANRLMHPRYGLEREYAVRVLGALTEEEQERLLDGVTLDDGEAAFSSIQHGGGEGVNQWYRVTISEGRNREVRRMLEAVGHAVSRLIRIRYGSVVLMRGLRRGMCWDLPERDLERLMQEAGMPQVAERAAPGKAQPGARGRSVGSKPQPAARGRRAVAAPPSGGSRTGAANAKPGQRAQPGPSKATLGYIGETGIRRNTSAKGRSNTRSRRP